MRNYSGEYRVQNLRKEFNNYYETLQDREFNKSLSDSKLVLYNAKIIYLEKFS